MNEIQLAYEMDEQFRDLVPVYHIGSCGCQGIAFFHPRRLPYPEAMHYARDVIFTNGSSPSPGSRMGPIHCGSCGVLIFGSVPDQLTYNDPEKFQKEKNTHE